MTDPEELPVLPDLQAASTMDARLRQIPTDPGLVERAIEAAHIHVLLAREIGDRQALISALGYLGEACRLAGRFEAADAALIEALTLARSIGDERLTVVGMLRLGELRRCQDRYPEAETLLREALRMVDDPGLPECAMYRDFALQHLGKALLDAGRPREAVAVLERALTIRKAAAASLIASTEEVLAHARTAACAGPSAAEA